MRAPVMHARKEAGETHESCRRDPIRCPVQLVQVTATLAQDAGLIERGREFVIRNCSRCHAVQSTGESPHRMAPPFRKLGEKYPVESLAEAFAEGIVVGHKDMLEFVLEPLLIRDVLRYIESIQSTSSR